MLNKKVLFITHNCSRTGAPIALLRFIKFLKLSDPSFDGVLLLRNSGPLKDEFKKYIKVIEFLPEKFYIKKNIFSFIINRIKLKFYKKAMLKLIIEEKFDLVYSNTIVNLNVLEFLEPLKLNIIVHFHELQNTVDHYGGNIIVEKTNKIAKHFIAVSKASAACLTENGVCKEKISVVYNSLDVNSIFIDTKKLNCPSLNKSINTFVVGGCGSIIHLKGYDLFIEVANIVINQKGYNDIKFFWVGHHASKEVMQAIGQKISMYNLYENVSFIGQVSEPYAFFNEIDLLLFTSRSESFGLTAIEAALFEKPTICFDNSGGVIEFVDSDCGIIVPQLDVRAMAEAVIQLYNSSNERTELGIKAKKKVVENHSQVIQLPKLINTINSL
ncbi:glycosyltransferase family 4 protein [Pontibacter sp. E15-1]|uniref:glycosyltransferase family 4 protein n=1 Tax=Pontibacter sp. E15-1 TaxID=2919918 RepID=UPI001F5040FF|nr:glycosyltransferase family 4 protein [Pontibacter sp. E15-1]MCJ8166334.1 glycosyltransferase family 4 protein [Pontibacter sp. E15-1]